MGVKAALTVLILVILGVSVFYVLSRMGVPHLWGGGEQPETPPSEEQGPEGQPQGGGGGRKPQGEEAAGSGELATGEVYFKSGGERVKALLFVPEEWGGACVILVHGLGSRKESWVRESVVDELVKAGFCCLVFDLPLHGERGRFKSLRNLPKVIIEGSRNIVDAAAWLRSRGADHVYIIGRSLGSIVASVALGEGAEIEKAELLLASANFSYLYEHGGLANDPKARREMGAWIDTDIVEEVDPLYKLPNYRGAVHIHCGKRDELLPPKSCEYAYNALTSASEKRLFWHDVGHRMPKELFIDEAIRFFKGGEEACVLNVSPIHVLFVLHFDPPPPRGGYFEVEGEACVRDYITSRDELVWLLDFADEYGVKMTALFNGFYMQLALRRGELEPLRRLAAGHEIGTHAHSLCYDEEGDRWYSCRNPDRWFMDAKKAVDDVLKVVGGENRVMCAMFRRGMYEVEDDLMAKYGYDIGLGNRPEIFYEKFGHIVWNPWRARCSNDPARALEWDPGVGFVSIDHRAQIGSTSSHGGVDSRSDTLKKMFLMLVVEWKVHEIRGEDRVWSWGVVHHPNFGDRYNEQIEDFFKWLNRHFIGRRTARGNVIAVYATASEVADTFYEWEARHPGEPSFSYVDGDPYPYACWYSREKLLSATYRGELDLGPQVHAFKFTGGDGRVFVLAWYEGQGTITVDLSKMFSGKVKVVTPTGEESEAQASSITLTEKPVFIEEG